MKVQIPLEDGMSIDELYEKYGNKNATIEIYWFHDDCEIYIEYEQKVTYGNE